MKTYYVETYRPPYPGRGLKICVHAERDYSRDVLSPGMTSVWAVQACRTKEEAIAAVVERAAGKRTAVSRVF